MCKVSRYLKNTTASFNDAWDVLHERVYMPHITIARIVFEDEGVLRRLGVSGQRPKGFGKWMQEALYFYNTLLENEDLSTQMTKRGIGRKKLEDARRDVEELGALKRLQEESISEAQEATRQRNGQRRAAVDWLADYRKIAHLALVDTPDLGEQLGLQAPSRLAIALLTKSPAAPHSRAFLWPFSLLLAPSPSAHRRNRIIVEYGHSGKSFCQFIAKRPLIAYFSD